MAYVSGGFVGGDFTASYDVPGASAGTPLDSIPSWQQLQSRCVCVPQDRMNLASRTIGVAMPQKPGH
jgi:hypothetical protein